jgi:hypothetical protein
VAGVGGWAGEWRLVCEIQWLEWVGLLAGEMVLTAIVNRLQYAT